MTTKTSSDSTARRAPGESGPPVYLSVTEARRKTEGEMRKFFAHAVSCVSSQDPPALAMRVSPGVGKTSIAMRLLARKAEPFLALGHVMFYVPTLDLAERAEAEFRALRSGLPSMVARGRDALHPDTGASMCERAAFARRISPLVGSVTRSICEARDRAGTCRAASCRAGCPYMAQREQFAPRVVFLSHSYLTVPPPVSGDVALRIVDEKVWPSLVSTIELSVEEWMQPAPRHLSNCRKRIYERARGIVVDALHNGRPILHELNAAGVEPAQLRTLGQDEIDHAPHLEIAPHDSSCSQERACDRFDPQRRRLAHRRGRILESLGKLGDRADTERLTLATRTAANGESQQLLRFAMHRPLPDDAPLLMLDADADPTIVNQLAPHADYVRVEATPRAEIVQVHDRTASNAWLLNGPSSGTHRRDLETVIRREVARAKGGVLVVAAKPVIRSLHRDAGAAGESDAELTQPLWGASPRWYGPRMQGVNDYEDFATAILIGRLQPNAGALEKGLRSLFGDGQEPIEFLGDEASQLVAAESQYLRGDGTSVPASVQTHPDPRGAALLAQMREAASLQAMARLRLVSPSRPKRVLLLSSLPLPGIPVTELTTWEALTKDVSAETLAPAYQRLKRALHRPDGRLVAGLRLSNAGLTADAPTVFPTMEAAREFRRGRSTGDTAAILRRIAQREGFIASPVRLTRRARGGRATPAVLFGAAARGYLPADQIWPGVESAAVAWKDL